MSTWFSLCDQLATVAAGAGATFVTGLAGSPHCAVMCGPLACAGLTAEPRARRRAALAWHAGRMGAYMGAGAILGGLGHAALSGLSAPAARVLPWVMVAGLVLSALEVGRRLPAIPGLSRVPLGLAGLGARVSPVARAALRGAATPFLPCGLLYGAFLIAAGAGTVGGGAVVMLAFSLGAIPALAFVQVNALRVAAHPGAQRFARYVVPALAAVVIAWRAVNAAPGSPHCH